MCFDRQRGGDKEAIKPANVYFAPPNYHLLINDDKTFSLSIDDKVNYARPSIDVLFESAVDVYAPWLVGVILTGANNDGAQGLRLIKERGGLAIVQDPQTAESAYMPKAALEATQVDYVLPLRRWASCCWRFREGHFYEERLMTEGDDDGTGKTQDIDR